MPQENETAGTLQRIGDFAREAGKRIDNFVRGVANGMTFGAADYVAGAADTLATMATGKNTTLRENIDQQNARTSEARTETPLAYGGGSIVGGAMTGFGIAGKAVGASVAENLTTAVVSDAATGLALSKTAIEQITKNTLARMQAAPQHIKNGGVVGALEIASADAVNKLVAAGAGAAVGAVVRTGMEMYQLNEEFDKRQATSIPNVKTPRGSSR